MGLEEFLSLFENHSQEEAKFLTEIFKKISYPSEKTFSLVFGGSHPILNQEILQTLFEKIILAQNFTEVVLRGSDEIGLVSGALVNSKGACVIARCLNSVKKPLLLLDLSHNEIGFGGLEGLKSLLAALDESFVTTLDLSFNEIVGREDSVAVFLSTRFEHNS